MQSEYGRTCVALLGLRAWTIPHALSRTRAGLGPPTVPRFWPPSKPRLATRATRATWPTLFLAAVEATDTWGLGPPGYLEAPAAASLDAQAHSLLRGVNSRRFVSKDALLAARYLPLATCRSLLVSKDALLASSSTRRLHIKIACSVKHRGLLVGRRRHATRSQAPVSEVLRRPEPRTASLHQLRPPPAAARCNQEL